MSTEAVSRIAKTILLTALCFVVVAAIRLALTVVRYRSLRRMLPDGGPRTAPSALCARVANGVTRAARIVPHATCLTQALAAQCVLAMRGYGSDVQIGVRVQEDGLFGAHAWLTCGRWIVIGGSPAELGRFESLTELAHH